MTLGGPKSERKGPPGCTKADPRAPKVAAAPAVRAVEEVRDMDKTRFGRFKLKLKEVQVKI